MIIKFPERELTVEERLARIKILLEQLVKLKERIEGDKR
jgi:hypothetical protein